MYDVDGGEPVQSATIHLINPNKAIDGAELVVSHQGKVLMRTPLGSTPSNAAVEQTFGFLLSSKTPKWNLQLFHTRPSFAASANCLLLRINPLTSMAEHFPSTAPATTTSDG